LPENHPALWLDDFPIMDKAKIIGGKVKGSRAGEPKIFAEDIFSPGKWKAMQTYVLAKNGGKT
jgi:hypothetical protein